MKSALIVEDSKSIAEIWRMTLCSEGFESITILDNGHEVEKKVLQLIPEIILMDINIIGELDGLELTSRISKMEKNIPVLVLTLHDEPEILRRAIHSGANGFVVKSSPLNEIRQAIQTLLTGNDYICEEMRKFSIAD